MSISSTPPSVRLSCGRRLRTGPLDGEFDYEIRPDDGEDWIPELHDVTLGRRRVGSSDYVFNGRLDAPWMTQGLLPESDIRRLYDAAFEGRLVTAPKPAAHEAVALEAAVDVPPETAVSMTVHQDTDGDGGSDISRTVAVDDGTDSYALDGFEAADDGAYWVALALETEDTEASPRVESVAVVVEIDEEDD